MFSLAACRSEMAFVMVNFYHCALFEARHRQARNATSFLFLARKLIASSSKKNIKTSFVVRHLSELLISAETKIVWLFCSRLALKV